MFPLLHLFLAFICSMATICYLPEQLFGRGKFSSKSAPGVKALRALQTQMSSELSVGCLKMMLSNEQRRIIFVGMYPMTIALSTSEDKQELSDARRSEGCFGSMQSAGCRVTMLTSYPVPADS